MSIRCYRWLSYKSVSCIVTIVLLLLFYRHFIYEPKIFETKPSTNDIRPEEETFPLAFSILAHSDLDRLKRLIKSIYRPHNFYCIHIDRKAGFDMMTALAEYLNNLGPNVYLVPNNERISVQWGTYSLLDAELLCARKAVQSIYKWKYYINLTGLEFALKTNWELVRILRIMNGSNLLEGCPVWKRHWAVPPRESYGNMSITWYEGSFHVALRRNYVDYMFRDPKAKLLLNSTLQHELRLKTGTFADEQYFITLNNNPSIIPIPGAYLGGPENCDKLPSLPRYKIWINAKERCMSGEFRNTICMLGQKDVPLLKKSMCLFANKFVTHVDPKGYDQIEEWIEMKRQYEIKYQQLHPSFNQTYYETLELRWNHL